MYIWPAFSTFEWVIIGGESWKSIWLTFGEESWNSISILLDNLLTFGGEGSCNSCWDFSLLRVIGMVKDKRLEMYIFQMPTFIAKVCKLLVSSRNFSYILDMCMYYGISYVWFRNNPDCSATDTKILIILEHSMDYWIWWTYYTILQNN